MIFAQTNFLIFNLNAVKMSRVFARQLSRSKTFLKVNPLVSAPKPAFYCSDVIQPFLCQKSDPRNHTINDVGLFYKVKNSVFWDVLSKDDNSKEIQNFKEECKTFNQTYLMIRKPAVEIINFLNHANYDNPINRYVLYGKHGHGVSTVMKHLLHYAYVSEWLVVYVPNILAWLTAITERNQSTTRPGLIDLPIFGSAWLSTFKNQNLKVINKLDLRIKNNYNWNIQEENKRGESLLGLLDHGIARGKYSCDVIVALLDEIKSFSKSGLVKTLVVLDKFSILFHPRRKSKNGKKNFLAPMQLSFMESFKNMAKADWHNGAVVWACLSERDVISDSEHLPLNKLSLQGFEFLMPFVPIEVPQLTNVEMSNLLDLYRSEKWLQRSDADKELKTLSCGSIQTLKDLCAPL